MCKVKARTTQNTPLHTTSQCLHLFEFKVRKGKGEAVPGVLSQHHVMQTYEEVEYNSIHSEPQD
jgi:hypothetical protein